MIGVTLSFQLALEILNKFERNNEIGVNILAVENKKYISVEKVEIIIEL